MKNLLLITLTGLLTVEATTPALALGPLDIEAELPLYSKYIWRGINTVDDYVLQPNLVLGVFGFGFNVWGNLELTDINENSGKFTEVNYEVGYGLGLPFIDLGLGSQSYIQGNFPVDPGLPWSPEYSNGASATDYFIDLKWPFHPIPFFTIAPSATWTSLLGDGKKSVDEVPDDAIYSGKTSNFYWGLSASFSF
jgi:hypothetical protein